MTTLTPKGESMSAADAALIARRSAPHIEARFVREVLSEFPEGKF
jgi:hypothetical protein